MTTIPLEAKLAEASEAEHLAEARSLVKGMLLNLETDQVCGADLMSTDLAWMARAREFLSTPTTEIAK